MVLIAIPLSPSYKNYVVNRSSYNLPKVNKIRIVEITQIEHAKKEAGDGSIYLSGIGKIFYKELSEIAYKRFEAKQFAEHWRNLEQVDDYFIPGHSPEYYLEFWNGEELVMTTTVSMETENFIVKILPYVTTLYQFDPKVEAGQYLTKKMKRKAEGNQ